MGRFLNLFSKGETCQLLINLEGKHVQRYQHFKILLDHNHSALALMAELEQMVYSGRPFHFPFAREKVLSLLTEIEGLLDSFLALSESKFSPLMEVFQKIKDDLNQELDPQVRYPSKDLVIPLEQITPDLKRMVGSKVGNLGLITSDLGLPVPEGFAVTARAFEKFIEENALTKAIENEWSRYAPEPWGEIEQISTTLRGMVLGALMPEEVQKAIIQAYEALEQKCGPGVRISMRSSAIGEDTEASFAGQFETVLNVTGSTLLEAYQTVLASKYSPRAILYRYQQGFDDSQTPMCVAGIRMIEARSSGVMYTRDPSNPFSTHIKISSLWGLGEHLVDGSASPDWVLIDRETKSIVARNVSLKETRLVASPQGGTALEKVPEGEKTKPSLNDDLLIQLADNGLKLEAYFGSPQDIEWALDQEGKLFILQSRPLALLEPKRAEKALPVPLTDYPILFSGGQAASPGIAVGRVFLLSEDQENHPIPEDAILVAKTASPNYAQWLGKIKGIITDIGSITSHLASVAREFGVPALFDTRQATALLSHGMAITLSADASAVYRGRAETSGENEPHPKNLFLESPVHRRLRTILDRISPLNLIDPAQPAFTPEGCRTLHDIIRFTHEQAVKEMFGLAEAAGRKAVAVRLTSTVPLVLYLVDLGGGLKDGLSTCEQITPDDFQSTPMRAIWKGFTHPGITWSGSINFDMKSFMTLMAAGATSEFGETPGGDSYALLSRDYLNFSAKFGYHFATVDTLCGENSSQNYIALQFSGGAGNYFGRSLRVFFLAEVLKKLGFEISIQGDLLEASLTGYDCFSMEGKLDQLGRLLACSRLLDMALSNERDIARLTDLFFKEEYDFLTGSQPEKPEGFYVQTGDWKQTMEEGHRNYLQDGSKAGFGMTAGLAGIVGKVTGASLQEFLDNIGAYYYFPLAIAKNSEMDDGSIEVQVKALKGNIDRAGGLVFGLKNAGNYFVLRINALEDNIILFEYINNKRVQRISVKKKIETIRWYGLKVEVKGRQIKGYVDEELILEYEAPTPVKGHVGLWTKADSVTEFRDLIIER